MAKVSSKFVSESAGKKNESKVINTADEGSDDNVELNDYYPFPIENEKVSNQP